MANQAAKFDLSSAFLDQPKTLAYGLVRGAGNLILQHELTDKTRVSFYMLGEGRWDSILRLWINNKLVTLPSSTTEHFHPGDDGEIGNGLTANSTGGDQHVDQFFTLIPGGLDPITFSRYAWLALKTAPDPGAPSAQLTVLADYQAMQVRQFDGSGNQTAFAWSQNPAWWICDFLIRKFVHREGKVNQPLVAAEQARFDWGAFTAAAAYYDTALGAPIAFIQYAAASGAGPTLAKAYTSNNAAGNLLVAFVWMASGNAFTSLVDTRGNTWVQIGSFENFTGTNYGVFYVASTAAGANTVTLTTTSTGINHIQLLEYSGLSATPLDVSASAHGTSTAPSAGPVTTTAAGDLLVFGAVRLGGGAVWTVGSGFTARSATSSPSEFAEDEITGAAGSYTGSATFVGAGDWIAFSVAFKAQPAGSGQKRFSDGGVVYLTDGNTAAQALEQMLLMCRSYLLERNGKLSLYADQPRSSVFTFNSGNVQANSFKAYKNSNLRTATNRLNPTYRDYSLAVGSSDNATRFAITSNPVLNHEAHQRTIGVRGPGLSLMPKITELVLDLGVNTPERVWRILKAMLVRQLGDDVDANSVYNAPWMYELTGYEDSLAVEPGDVVTIDPSISEEHGGKQFEVLEPTYDPNGPIHYVGLEYMPNAFPDVAPSQQGLQAPIPGSGIQVPAGGANFSYRPLSNPLTAADTGTVPEATIAAFTMRVAGVDIAITGGFVDATSGDYGKTAFIYYDDPSLVGGAVAFNLTFTRETAISGFARFFVGSIILPLAGGGAMVGFNDGGTGAQYAKTFRLLPTSQTLTGAWTNPTKAIDNDLSSYAVASSTSANVVMVANVFPSFSGLFSVNTLAVLSQVTAIAIGPVLIEYSFDGGANWMTLRSTTTTDATPVLSTVPVPLSINTNLVQVRVTLPGGTGTPTNVTAYAGTGADDAAIGTVAWVNPTNAQGNQTSVFASAQYNTSDSVADSHYLKLTNFGFAIAAGATINGIQAIYTIKSNYIDDGLANDRFIFDNSIRLYKAGVLAGTGKSNGANWPTTTGTRTFGGSTDLWGTTWTLTDINNSGFGIGNSVELENDGNKTGARGQVYSVAITVFYTTSSGAASATTRIYDISQQVTL